MAECRQAVQPIRISYACDICGGECAYTQRSKTSAFLGGDAEPVRYQHECGGCKRILWLERIYPAIEYENSG